MKSFSLLILSLSLISVSSFAREVGSYQVKGCSLVVPRNTPNDVVSMLMEKGFQPMNVVGADVYELKLGVHGSFEYKTKTVIHKIADLEGYPYLEMKNNILPGVTFANLAIGIVGLPDMSKYNSEKTTVASQQKEGVTPFSADQLPACTNPVKK